MKNKMQGSSFEKLLRASLLEYREKKALFGVPVVLNETKVPVGPAAGPHTQLSQNIVSAYAAGAIDFELKTVQIIDGEDIHIEKPCIFSGSEVYNIEWSTELTVKEALFEYIKAAILIQVLSKEFSLTPFSKIKFIMSVGYDLKGIKSEKIDYFLNSMKDCGDTDEWKNDILFLKKNLNLFNKISLSDIDALSSKISDTVTLSTMHGCPASEIEGIAEYLIKDKGLNAYIKLNPTLLGKDRVTILLKEKGFDDISLSDSTFDKDLKLDDAVGMIGRLQETASENGLKFGVKLTNTLPVNNNSINGKDDSEKILKGNEKYLSGTALFPISINVAKLLSEKVQNIEISYSGGIDDKNIKDVLECGIKPVTVSSFLLKPNGYKNLSKLIVNADIPEKINLDKLTELCEKTISDGTFDRKIVKRYENRPNYSSECALCHNCEDICPNRANRRLIKDGKEVVLHDVTKCNECGACMYFCIMGHKPYLEKAGF